MNEKLFSVKPKNNNQQSISANDFQALKDAVEILKEKRQENFTNSPSFVWLMLSHAGMYIENQMEAYFRNEEV